MEENGYIRSYWGNEATGARRRYYSLTEPGRQKLTEDLAAWAETRRVMDTLLENAPDRGRVPELILRETEEADRT